jgi:PmbA protein
MIVEKILRKAMEQADDAQVLVQSEETSGVEFEDNRLKSAETSQRTHILVKVIKDGRLGSSTTTDPEEIDGVVQRALEAAEFGSPVHFQLPEPEGLAEIQTYDPELLLLEKDEMIHIGQGMMNMITAYNPEIQAAALVRKNIQKTAFANSAGVNYANEDTNFVVLSGGQLTRGTDILFAFDSAGIKNRQVDPEEIAAQAIEKFQLAEQIAPVESGEMPVIFTPRGFVAILHSLALALDGKNTFLGASPLRDKLGEAVADARFSLVDDPLVAFGPRTGAFDDEGVVRKAMPLVEKGVLKNFLYDLDTAGRAGAEATGHGSTRTFSNLVISPGERSYKEMIAEMKDGLLVHDFLGLGQGNPINGEFSLNVFLGYRIQDGKLVGRVKDVMLAGNAFEALMDIDAISQEREWVSGPYTNYEGLMPYIQVGALSVTAK